MKIRAWGFLRLSAVIISSIFFAGFIVGSIGEIYEMKIWYCQAVFIFASIIGLAICVSMVIFELRARSLNR